MVIQMKITEVSYNLIQLVIGLVQKTSLTFRKISIKQKTQIVIIKMYQSKGTGKIAVRSFNKFKHLYQSNTTEVIFHI